MPPSNNPLFPPRPPAPTSSQISTAITHCLSIQRLGVANNKQPFAALLLGPDNTTILLTHSNIDHVNHAESSLARLAAAHYTQSYLWTCTLVSTWEPCAMCAATVYWANIGRVVYAAPEARLAELTGEGVEENMTMALPCRTVLGAGQKHIEVIGPLEELAEVVIAESDKYWKRVREGKAR